MLLLSLITIIAVAADQVIVDLEAYTETQIRGDWDIIKQKLYGASTLKINYAGHSENSLLRVLSADMPKLKILTFNKYHFDRSTPMLSNINNQRQYLTPKLFQAIFRAKYVYQLTEINLIATNLDDRHFDFMDQYIFAKREFRLQRIKLGANYIGRGALKQLSRFKFNNIKQLDISGNLLVDFEAVKSIVDIICNKKEGKDDRCYNQIQSLDISSTNIRPQGFIKLIGSINPRTLKYLNLSNNNLHLNKKYSDGYNLTAYQFLSKMQFSELIELQMNDLSLDYDVLSVLKNWKLPKLKGFMLFANFIDDEGLKVWINKRNFPSLERLILYNNYLGDSSLAHIRMEEFDLIELNIGFNPISSKGISQIASFRSAKLQKLYFKQIKLQSKQLKILLDQTHLQNIRQLGFSGNSEIGDIFTYFPWWKIPIIQKLIMTDCYIQDSISQLINYKKVLAPNLNLILFNNTGSNQQSTLKLLHNIVNIFPKLEFIDLIQNFIQPLNFSEVVNSSISQILRIDLGYVRFIKKNNRLSILKLSSLGILALCSVSQDLTRYFEYPKQIAVKIQRYIDLDIEIPKILMKSISMQLCRIFDFSHIKILKIEKAHELDVFSQIVQNQNIQIFQNLQYLHIQIDTPIAKIIKLLQRIKLPKLRQLRLSLIMNEYSYHFYFFTKILKDQLSLTDLRLIFNFKNVNKVKYNFNQYFNKLYFPFLETLQITQSHLKPQQISGFIHNHAKSLRTINLNNNFLEKSFIGILASNKLILEHIDLSFITFKIQQFIQLHQLQLSYLRILRLQGCDLSTQHIILLMDRVKNTTELFPKLGTLILDDNDIRQEGIIRLFQKGFSQLIYLKINRNFNPNFINIILSYCTKLMEIIAIGTDVYSLSKYHRPISTRRVNVMAIATNDFQMGDFDVMGSLQYKKLMFSQIIVKQVYDCRIFENMLKINSYASKIVIWVDNDKPGLNSTCLRDNKIFSQYHSQVQEILINDKHYTTIYSQFLQILLRSQRNLKTLMLYQTKAPPSVFSSISAERLKHIQIINIPRNYMNDEAFDKFLISPMLTLKFLDISQNQITIRSFRGLKYRQFPRLQEINFSGLDIGDESILVISTMKMPQLKRLFMMSCQISNITSFNEVYLPNLFTLGLQRNRYTFQQAIIFLQNLNRHNLPMLQNLSLKGLTLIQSQHQRIIDLCESRNITIELDKPYYLEHSNLANY